MPHYDSMNLQGSIAMRSKHSLQSPGSNHYTLKCVVAQI